MENNEKFTILSPLIEQLSLEASDWQGASDRQIIEEPTETGGLSFSRLLIFLPKLIILP